MKKAALNSNQLKLIAIAAMTLDILVTFAGILIMGIYDM